MAPVSGATSWQPQISATVSAIPCDIRMVWNATFCAASWCNFLYGFEQLRSSYTHSRSNTAEISRELKILAGMYMMSKVWQITTRYGRYACQADEECQCKGNILCSFLMQFVMNVVWGMQNQESPWMKTWRYPEISFHPFSPSSR